MLSIEMAKKLKEAGLVWNPDIGDIFFYDEGHWDSLSLNDVINGEFKGEILDYIEEEWLFAPRLDQLLAEIEKRGWKHELYSHPEFGKYHCVIQKGGIRRLFDANSPEEAAAQSLLWILEQKKRAID